MPLKVTTTCTDSQTATSKNVAVIPYLHRISHNLKKIGHRAGVSVAFSAPNKLSQFCARNSSVRKPPNECKINHRNQYVQCAKSAVYDVPLTCSLSNVGQSGRCLKVPLLEHNQKAKKGSDGFLATHGAECKWMWVFDKTTVLTTHPSNSLRLIVEAAAIANQSCLSKPFITLTKKSTGLLEFTEMWLWLFYVKFTAA